MRAITRSFILSAMVGLVGSCASLGGGGGSGPDVWKYEREAVHVCLKSDPLLNLYQDKSHTLMVCIYQMRDPNAFNQALDERDGLQKLLDCGRFDSSVTNAKRIVVQPGTDKNEILDRYEGTKYVGIVGGYYVLEKDTAAGFFQIPMGGFFSKKPKPLNLTIFLQPQELHGVVE